MGEKRRSFYFVATVPETKKKAWTRLGDADSLTLDDARRASRERAGRIARGENPNAAAREARRAEKRAANRPTVATLVSQYIHERTPHISAATLGNYQRLLDAEISPSALGRRLADDVIRSEVRDFLRPQSPYVGSHLLALIRAAYRWGEKEEIAAGMTLVNRNPTSGIEDPSPRVRRQRHLSDEEIPQFSSGVETMRSAEKAFLRLILLLGLRRGEAYAARWDRVDFENRLWTVPSLDRKLRKKAKAMVPDLEVPLSELALAELHQLQQATRRQRGRMFTLSIGRVGPDMKKATALGDVTVHDLRCSCSMGIERLGAPPHIVGLVLGHTRVPGAIASDLHYTLQRRPTEVREWLERWADHVGSLVGSSVDTAGSNILAFGSSRAGV